MAIAWQYNTINIDKSHYNYNINKYSTVANDFTFAVLFIQVYNLAYMSCRHSWLFMLRENYMKVLNELIIF